MKKNRSTWTPAEKRKYIAERASKLWDIVREERAEQLSREDRPFRQWFEEAWARLEPMYEGAMKRDDDEFTAETPMDALLFYAEGCMYPPPEILLGVYRCYQDYLYAGGEMTLEEALFGPSKPKAGNRARQFKTGLRYTNWMWRLEKLEGDGHSRTHAAELIALESEGRYDADTILRMANKHRAQNSFYTSKRKGTKSTPV